MDAACAYASQMVVVFALLHGFHQSHERRRMKPQNGMLTAVILLLPGQNLSEYDDYNMKQVQETLLLTKNPRVMLLGPRPACWLPSRRAAISQGRHCEADSSCMSSSTINKFSSWHVLMHDYARWQVSSPGEAAEPNMSQCGSCS